MPRLEDLTEEWSDMTTEQRRRFRELIESQDKTKNAAEWMAVEDKIRKLEGEARDAQRGEGDE